MGICVSHVQNDVHPIASETNKEFKDIEFTEPQLVYHNHVPEVQTAHGIVVELLNSGPLTPLDAGANQYVWTVYILRSNGYMSRNEGYELTSAVNSSDMYGPWWARKPKYTKNITD